MSAHVVQVAVLLTFDVPALTSAGADQIAMRGTGSREWNESMQAGMRALGATLPVPSPLVGSWDARLHEPVIHLGRENAVCGEDGPHVRTELVSDATCVTCLRKRLRRLSREVA